ISIDWEQPLIAQAEVLRLNDNYIDIGLDPKESPYRLIEGKLFFEVNNGEQYEWKSTVEFDKKGKYIVPQTGEYGCLGENWDAYHAEPTMPGIVRLHFNFKRKPQIGNYLIMRHIQPSHTGIYIHESENISVNNLKLFHAVGTGILANKSKNLNFIRYMAIPNSAKTRYFSGSSKGLEIVNCGGQILINNCTFHGLMEESAEVFSTGIRIDEIVDQDQIKCSLVSRQDIGLEWATKGDKLNYFSVGTMTLSGTNTVNEVVPVNDTTFILQLQQNVPQMIKPGDILKNREQQPELTVENSNFKSCNGHSLLLSSVNKATIQSNNFESSGSAIFIGTKNKSNYKSGMVANVLITRNIFSSYCNSSPYYNGEAIISIYPETPEIDENSPALFRNISIENNIFNPFDYPLLYAQWVEDLSFVSNSVTQSYNYSPYHHKQYNFSFIDCKGISIRNNDFSDNLLGKILFLKKTPKNQLDTDLSNGFSIEQY
ncbi:MAG TPA: hypothetical protein VEP89_08795, partial [Draconibacterium sp.]|nr:hypothetical protein [Draconibacterium sp.]